MLPKRLPMVAARMITALATIAAVPLLAQANGGAVNIPGTLELVDKPPAAVSVEYLNVTIHQLPAGPRYSANPNRAGNFTLNGVPPGRYSLELSFPGRVRMTAIGSRSVMPDEFELTTGESGPLRIVVSLKTAVLRVDVSGIPDKNPPVVAIVFPADPYLMPRDSGILNPVSGHYTEFRYLTPGNYSLFVVDEDFKWAITSSAVRDALKDKATEVQIRDDGETTVAATYVTADVVRQAIATAKWEAPVSDKPAGKAHEK